MKSKNLSKQCAKSRTLNNEINQKLSHFIQKRQRAMYDSKISRTIFIESETAYQISAYKMH